MLKIHVRTLITLKRKFIATIPIGADLSNLSLGCQTQWEHQHLNSKTLLLDFTFDFFTIHQFVLECI